MSNDELSVETAKAAQETAKAVQKAAELGQDLVPLVEDVGTYVGRILGGVPEDVIGLLGGDYIRHVRIRNLAKHAEKTKKILEDRGIYEGQEDKVSFRLARPLLNAVADETNEELHDIWAALMANAMDPSTSSVVRKDFIETVQMFEPLDAKVFVSICDKYYEFTHKYYIGVDKNPGTIRLTYQI